MSARGKGGAPGGEEAPPGQLSSRFTRLRNASQGTWDALRSEAGIHALPVRGGRTFHITRRGSFMHGVENRDGTYDVRILHSVRTAHLLGQVEARDRNLASMRSARLAEQEPDYTSPEFPSTTQGHIAEVRRFRSTQRGGFEEIGSGRFHSGKAGGNFSARRMRPVHDAGWPEGSAEQTHHSEADYAATQLASPAAAGRGQIVVHQMVGGNDMCSTCQEGMGRTVARTGGQQFASYMGREPFGTRGDWPARGASARRQGNIVRSRPESMLRPEDRLDHMDRAMLMADLRNPERRRKRSPEPGFRGSHDRGGGGPGPKPPPPPPPPGAGGVGDDSIAGRVKRRRKESAVSA